jgi:hypothetical protein
MTVALVTHSLASGPPQWGHWRARTGSVLSAGIAWSLARIAPDGIFPYFSYLRSKTHYDARYIDYRCRSDDMASIDYRRLFERSAAPS